MLRTPARRSAVKPRWRRRGAHITWPHHARRPTQAPSHRGRRPGRPRGRPGRPARRRRPRARHAARGRRHLRLPAARGGRAARGRRRAPVDRRVRRGGRGRPAVAEPRGRPAGRPRGRPPPLRRLRDRGPPHGRAGLRAGRLARTRRGPRGRLRGRRHDEPGAQAGRPGHPAGRRRGLGHRRLGRRAGDAAALPPGAARHAADRRAAPLPAARRRGVAGRRRRAVVAAAQDRRPRARPLPDRPPGAAGRARGGGVVSPLRVLVAGGGVAAVEAVLALRALAAEHVDVELLAPGDDFVHRPASVLTPFSGSAAPRLPLDRLGVTRHEGALAAIDADRRLATTTGGRKLPYDRLIVATGARSVEGVPGATTFRGPLSAGAVEGALRRSRTRALFALPDAATWTLPAYELAL